MPLRVFQRRERGQKDFDVLCVGFLFWIEFEANWLAKNDVLSELFGESIARMRFDLVHLWKDV